MQYKIYIYLLFILIIQMTANSQYQPSSIEKSTQPIFDSQSFLPIQIIDQKELLIKNSQKIIDSLFKFCLKQQAQEPNHLIQNSDRIYGNLYQVLRIPPKHRTKKQLDCIKEELKTFQYFYPKTLSSKQRIPQSLRRKQNELCLQLIAPFAKVKLYKIGDIIQSTGKVRDKIRFVIHGQVKEFEPANHQSYRNCLRKIQQTGHQNQNYQQLNSQQKFINQLTIQKCMKILTEHEIHTPNTKHEFRRLVRSGNIISHVKMNQDGQVNYQNSGHNISELVCQQRYQSTMIATSGSFAKQCYECVVLQIDLPIAKIVNKIVVNERQKTYIQQLMQSFNGLNYAAAQQFVQKQRMLENGTKVSQLPDQNIELVKKLLNSQVSQNKDKQFKLKFYPCNISPQSKKQLNKRICKENNQNSLQINLISSAENNSIPFHNHNRDVTFSPVKAMQSKVQSPKKKNIAYDYSPLKIKKDEAKTYASCNQGSCFMIPFDPTKMHLIIEGHVSVCISRRKQKRISNIEFARGNYWSQQKQILKLGKGSVFGIQDIGRQAAYKLRYKVSGSSKLLQMPCNMVKFYQQKRQTFKKELQKMISSRNYIIKQILGKVVNFCDEQQKLRGRLFGEFTQQAYYQKKKNSYESNKRLKSAFKVLTYFGQKNYLQQKARIHAQHIQNEQTAHRKIITYNEERLAKNKTRRNVKSLNFKNKSTSNEPEKNLLSKIETSGKLSDRERIKSSLGFTNIPQKNLDIRQNVLIKLLKNRKKSDKLYLCDDQVIQMFRKMVDNPKKTTFQAQLTVNKFPKRRQLGMSKFINHFAKKQKINFQCMK